MMIIDNNKLIIRVIAFSFFIFSLYYIFVYKDSILNYASYQYDEFRLGWEFENPNTVGSFMTLALALSSYVVIFQKDYFRFSFILPSLTFLLVGFTTGSRTFIISIFVIAFVYVLMLFKRHVLISLLISVAIISASVVLINFVPFLSTIKYRLDDTINAFLNGGASGSTLERILWQKYGFYLSSRRMLFGFGESGFAYASGVMTYTHGNFTEMLCDFGIIGFLLFYFFTLGPAFYVVFSSKKDKGIIIAISFILLFDGFLSVYYYDKCTYVVMALCYYLLDNAEPSFKIFKRIPAPIDYFEVNI